MEGTAGKKKFTVILIIAVVVSAFLYIGYMAKMASGAESGQLEISFDFKFGTRISPEMGLASAQYAVWIEDSSGQLVKTLYVTSYTAKGGYNERPESIPVWVAKAKPDQLSQTQIDAISGATVMRDGVRTYLWDCRDGNGNAVAPGTYNFFVEGSYSWSSKVLYSGTVTVGGLSQNNIPIQADYNDQETHNRDMITNVQAKYMAPVSANAILKYFIGSTSYTLNGATQTMDAAPIISQDRTFMPIRFITDNIGAQTRWNEQDQTVTITMENKTIVLTIGSATARVNDVPTPIDPNNQNVLPFIIDGRTMMPLRFIAENLDCDTDWDPGSRMVTISF